MCTVLNPVLHSLVRVALFIRVGSVYLDIGAVWSGRNWGDISGSVSLGSEWGVWTPVPGVLWTTRSGYVLLVVIVV